MLTGLPRIQVFQVFEPYLTGLLSGIAFHNVADTKVSKNAEYMKRVCVVAGASSLKEKLLCLRDLNCNLAA